MGKGDRYINHRGAFILWCSRHLVPEYTRTWNMINCVICCLQCTTARVGYNELPALSVLFGLILPGSFVQMHSRCRSAAVNSGAYRPRNTACLGNQGRLHQNDSGPGGWSRQAERQKSEERRGRNVFINSISFPRQKKNVFPNVRVILTKLDAPTDCSSLRRRHFFAQFILVLSRKS